MEQVPQLEEFERINIRLKELYGSQLDGRQNFRVSWSNNEREWRRGTFRDFTPSGIYLGERTETRNVLKYPGCKDCFVVEKLVFSPMTELVTSDKGHYELVWALMDMKTRKPLPLSWNPVNFLIHLLLYGGKRTASDFEDELRKEEFEEVNTYFQIIDNELPYLPDKLVEGSAVTVPELPKETCQEKN